MIDKILKPTAEAELMKLWDLQNVRRRVLVAYEKLFVIMTAIKWEVASRAVQPLCGFNLLAILCPNRKLAEAVSAIVTPQTQYLP